MLLEGRTGLDLQQVCSFTEHVLSCSGIEIANAVVLFLFFVFAERNGTREAIRGLTK